MNVRYMLDNVNKDDSNKQILYAMEFNELADLNCSNIPYEELTRLVAYYVNIKYESGGYIGEKVYYFDDKPVAFDSSPNKIAWVSQEAYMEVKRYIATFESQFEADILDLTTEYSNSYNMFYVRQLMKCHTVAYINGTKVTVNPSNRLDGKYKTKDKVEIIYENGNKEMMDIEKLSFPFHVSGIEPMIVLQSF